MAQATMINPQTGDKKVVEAGSRQASALFGEGYYLMGAEGQAVGAAPPPTTPIAAQQNLNLPQQVQPRDVGSLFGGMQAPPQVEAPPDMTGHQEFNTGMMGLLQTMQTLNPADLQIRKNALLKAQYNRVSEITPEEFRTLSPSEQAAIRGAKAGALTPEIESVQNMITKYQGQIANFGNILGMAMDIGTTMRQQEVQDYQMRVDVDERNYQRQTEFKTGIQNQIYNMFQTFGAGALEGIDDAGLAELESMAGMPTGLIRMGMNALQRAEDKADNKEELAIMREFAFSQTTLEGGVAPQAFLDAFPELIPVWESMSTASREGLDIERQQAGLDIELTQAQIAKAKRPPVGRAPNNRIETLDGRKVLINMETGDVIRDLGEADASAETEAFYDRVNAINDDIAAKRQTSEGGKKVLKGEFGTPDDILNELVNPDEQQARRFIDVQFLMTSYGIKQKEAEQYMTRVNGYRLGGLTDAEILDKLS